MEVPTFTISFDDSQKILANKVKFRISDKNYVTTVDKTWKLALDVLLHPQQWVRGWKWDKQVRAQAQQLQSQIPKVFGSVMAKPSSVEPSTPLREEEVLRFGDYIIAGITRYKKVYFTIEKPEHLIFFGMLKKAYPALFDLHTAEDIKKELIRDISIWAESERKENTDVLDKRIQEVCEGFPGLALPVVTVSETNPETGAILTFGPSKSAEWTPILEKMISKYKRTEDVPARASQIGLSQKGYQQFLADLKDQLK